jgi:hypothetical protein
MQPAGSERRYGAGVRRAAAAALRLAPVRYRMQRGDLLRLAWVHPSARAMLFAATLAAFRATPATAKKAIGLLSALLLLIGVAVDPLAFGLLVAVLIWSLPILLAKAVALRLLGRKLLPCRVGSECVLSVEEAGLRWDCDGQQQTIAWREIRAILESSPLLLVRHVRGDLILPSRAFASAGQREDLRTLLSVRSGHSPKWVFLPGAATAPA